jgi:hypothetical protein
MASDGNGGGDRIYDQLAPDAHWQRDARVSRLAGGAVVRAEIHAAARGTSVEDSGCGRAEGERLRIGAGGGWTPIAQLV